MKRARIVLCIIGAVMCAISIGVLPFTPVINDFGRVDQPKRIAESGASNSSPAHEAARLTPETESVASNSSPDHAAAARLT
jgi:hypothetical protein